MHAMVVEEFQSVEKEPLHWIDVNDPWPGDGEIRIRVEACGVCRTDLHLVEGELPSRKRPLIPGHQIVGRVDKVGKGVTRFQVGARVGVGWLRSACGRCVYCSSGQENLCDSSKYTGWDADGGYAEFAVVPAAFAYALPQDLPAANVAPLLCAGIVGYRAFKRADVPSKGTLGIFGFGSSAHVILQVARAEGIRVFVVSRSEAHRKLATEMGADWVGKTAFDLPRKLDSAILFAPSGDLVPIAMQSLRKGGTLATAGILLSDIPTLQYEKTLFYEKNLRSVTAHTRADGEEFLKLAVKHSIRPLATAYNLKDANRALLDLKNDRVNGSAVLTLA